MLFAWTVLFAAVDAGRTSADISPVDQVLSLLRSLEGDVQREGVTEARNYEKFACFCKTKTNGKVDSINTRDATKTRLAGEIKAAVAQAAELNFNIEKLTADYGQMESELAKAQAIRDEENAVYNEVYGDLSKAVVALGSALDSIRGSKKANFMQTKEAVIESLKLADAMGKSPKAKAAMALLQGPNSDYDFHSGGIIETITGIKEDFTAEKTRVNNEENTAQTAFSNAAQAKRQAIGAAKATVNTDTNTLRATDSSIATKSGLETENNANLNDDRTYLKDLTGQCEVKAREWDQRSKTRADELTALGSAITTISGTVKGHAQGSDGAGRKKNHLLLSLPVSDSDDEVDDAEDYEDVVFVQTQSVKKARVEDRESQVRSKAVTMIKKDAEELNSVALSMLAMRVAADPFAKVKTLVQKLIERLLTESADEATQKGFCDTSLAKANTDRDYRQGDLDELTANINEMLANKAALETEHSELTQQRADLQQAKTDASNLRHNEKAANKVTLDHAKAGLTALNGAINVLETFYKNAAKPSSTSLALVETSSEGSPVDQDMNRESNKHLGAYEGNQAQAGGILGMLATIKSDFQRTIQQTEDSEAEAAATFVKFVRETKASIQSKETGMKMNHHDTVETTGDLQAALQELHANQDLLDEALKSLEILRPKCIDTKMSYAERVQRREKEIVALKKAVCVLDEGDDEVADCSGAWASIVGF